MARRVTASQPRPNISGVSAKSMRRRPHPNLIVVVKSSRNQPLDQSKATSALITWIHGITINTNTVGAMTPKAMLTTIEGNVV